MLASDPALKPSHIASGEKESNLQSLLREVDASLQHHLESKNNVFSCIL